MQREFLLHGYVVRPAEVAKTLLMPRQAWDGTQLETRSSTGVEPLFSLRQEGEETVLSGALGEFRMTREQIKEAEPDPLWESSPGICSHMEADHADTFIEFLKSRGFRREVHEQILMPWVEQRGFFLCGPDVLAWVPFPQECPTPNDVRKNMIKMLRENRDDRS